MNCGALCLVHIHESHGQKLSLTRARKIAKTTKKGTYARDLVDALEQLGYKNVRLKRRMTWNELKREVERGNDVIVSWWSVLDANGLALPPDGHWSIAKKVTKDSITLFDPDATDLVELPKEMFLSHWWDWERDHAGKRDDFIRAAVIARYPRKKTT